MSWSIYGCADVQISKHCRYLNVQSTALYRIARYSREKYWHEWFVNGANALTQHRFCEISKNLMGRVCCSSVPGLEV